MRRVPEFDALRGIAAIAIVFYHYSYPTPWYQSLFYIGGCSLELFFVLSGFLITGIILENQGNRAFVVNFYARRSLRIWPIYYLALFAIVASTWFRPGLFPMDGFWNHLTYTQNIQCYAFREPPLFAYPFMHTWTLAVEEQFYLFWPLLVGLSGRKRLLPLALLCVGTAVATRAYGFSPKLLLSRCDGFALGGVLALLLGSKPASPERRIVLQSRFTMTLVAALLFLTLGMWSWGETPFSLEGPASFLSIFATAVFFFALVGLVILHAGCPALAPLRSRWLCYLGRISYGIYLYHLPAMIVTERIAARLGEHSQLRIRALGLAATIAVSALSWAFIERPVLRLKDRFRYHDKKGVDAPSSASRRDPEGPQPGLEVPKEVTTPSDLESKEVP